MLPNACLVPKLQFEPTIKIYENDYNSSVKGTDAQGVHTSKKVQAILEVPAPCDIHELCYFLGLLNYCAKFLPNLPSKLHSLHKLLKDGELWLWSKACECSFEI